MAHQEKLSFPQNGFCESHSREEPHNPNCGGQFYLLSEFYNFLFLYAVGAQYCISVSSGMKQSTADHLLSIARAEQREVAKLWSEPRSPGTNNPCVLASSADSPRPSFVSVLPIASDSDGDLVVRRRGPDSYRTGIITSKKRKVDQQKEKEQDEDHFSTNDEHFGESCRRIALSRLSGPTSCVTLARSRIHGVGVVAIVRITAGSRPLKVAAPSSLPSFSQCPSQSPTLPPQSSPLSLDMYSDISDEYPDDIAIPHAQLTGVSAQVRNCLRDRYYFDEKVQWCPLNGLNTIKSFEEFLNHSETPNLQLVATADGSECASQVSTWELECTRDVEAGEELTIDYRTAFPSSHYYTTQVGRTTKVKMKLRLSMNTKLEYHNEYVGKPLQLEKSFASKLAAVNTCIEVCGYSVAPIATQVSTKTLNKLEQQGKRKYFFELSAHC